MVERALDDLRRACQHIGAQVPLWTQGAGGNVSIKADDSLFIKASGQRLAAVQAAKTYARLPVAAFRQRLHHIVTTHPAGPAGEADYAAALNALCAPKWGQPSMEAGMHVLLPGRCVAHFHALTALLMGHHEMEHPGTIAAFFAAHGVVAKAVPATLPGLQLTCAFMPTVQAQVIVLGNHGVVLQGDTPDEILQRWQHLEQAFCNAFDYPTLRAYLAGRPPPRNLPAPMRLYFPDTAVFADRLSALLTAAPNADPHPCSSAESGPNSNPDLGSSSSSRSKSNDIHFTLQNHAWNTDPNTAELWWATTLLYALCPTLAVLPPAQAAAVRGLPTELWRRNVVQPLSSSHS